MCISGEAESSAARLGADGNFVWSAFGLTNVRIHQVVIANEFGDAQRAIEIGRHLDTSALPVERRVRHAIETARAHARWNQVDEALDALLTAERIGPDPTRPSAVPPAVAGAGPRDSSSAAAAAAATVAGHAVERTYGGRHATATMVGVTTKRSESIDSCIPRPLNDRMPT